MLELEAGAFVGCVTWSVVIRCGYEGKEVIR